MSEFQAKEVAVVWGCLLVLAGEPAFTSKH